LYHYSQLVQQYDFNGIWAFEKFGLYIFQRSRNQKEPGIKKPAACRI
jgi:hypothetical protein